MKIVPYLNFDGNCGEALAFYEGVFGARAEVFFYKDAVKFDAGFKVEKGKEDWIMHAHIAFEGGGMIQFADCDQQGKNFGTNICLQLSFEKADEVERIFSALSDGAKQIICPPSPTFYSPIYAELVDKFGIRWSIMQS